jgi:hypothetical protein
MNISSESVVSITSTGVHVQARLEFRDGTEELVPVVAWATVVTHLQDSEADTRIYPVVLYDGDVWTEQQLKDNYTLVKVVLHAAPSEPGAG